MKHSFKNYAIEFPSDATITLKIWKGYNLYTFKNKEGKTLGFYGLRLNGDTENLEVD